MTGIPDGDYELYSMSGIDWNGQQFMKQASASKFADLFPFRTTREQDGLWYKVWEVTLHEVIGGKAKTIPLNPEEFPAIAVE